MERENLHGDAKGKGTSGADRKAESTDAPVRGGLLRSSDEASVMLVERREQAIAIWIGSTGNGRNPIVNGRRQPSCDGTSRMNREVHVRICERLGVKCPGPTRHWRIKGNYEMAEAQVEEAIALNPNDGRLPSLGRICFFVSWRSAREETSARQTTTLQRQRLCASSAAACPYPASIIIQETCRGGWRAMFPKVPSDHSRFAATRGYRVAPRASRRACVRRQRARARRVRRRGHGGRAV